MKKIFIVTLFTFVLSGCASSPPREEPAKKPEVPPKKVIEVEIPHLLRETRYLRNGSMDDYRILTYEEGTGTILSEEIYDPFDNLREKTLYLYSEEGVVRRETKDSEGDILSYEILRYDEDGRLTTRESSTPQGGFSVSSHYVYDERGNRIRLTVEEGGEVLSRFDYTFQGDLNVRGSLTGADGEVWNTYMREYDDQNRLVKETTLNERGEQEKEVVYIYEGKFLVAEEHRNKSGVLSRRLLFENDDRGSPLLITMMDRGGSVFATVERSYFYTVEKHLPEEQER